jgi:ligand-binding sensor domain-containing protein
MKQAVFLIAMGCAFAPLRCDASLDPSKDMGQYVRQVWGTDWALPPSVQAITQTADGYLWIGTESGLARFDGIRFVVFDKKNTKALHSDQVTALLVDRQQNLWVGTHGGGISRFPKGHMDRGLHLREATDLTVNVLFEDRQGVVWAGTEGAGLLRLAGDSASSVRHCGRSKWSALGGYLSGIKPFGGRQTASA